MRVIRPRPAPGVSRVRRPARFLVWVVVAVALALAAERLVGWLVGLFLPARPDVFWEKVSARPGRSIAGAVLVPEGGTDQDWLTKGISGTV